MEATDSHNRCKRLEDTLVLHYYGELGPTASLEVAAHLASCPRCRAEFEHLSATLDAVPAYSLNQQEVRRTAEGVMERLPQLRPSGTRRWLVPASAAVAAAVLAVVVAMHWYPATVKQNKPQMVVAQADWDTLNNLDVLPDIDVIQDMDTIDQIENM